MFYQGTIMIRLWLAGMTKISSYITKPTQTRINRNKYVNGSVKCKFGGTSKNLCKKTKRDAYSGLDLSIYAIKSPIQLVRQSFEYSWYSPLVRDFCP
jgi:hypothetical protein